MTYTRTVLLKQSDLTRYVKAMRKLDVVEYRVVVRTDGTHEIVVGKTSIAPGGATGWEDVV